MLIFEERGKPENPEKNLAEQSKESTTILTQSWPHPGQVGGRRVQSPLRHPCSPERTLNKLTRPEINPPFCLIKIVLAQIIFSVVSLYGNLSDNSKFTTALWFACIRRVMDARGRLLSTKGAKEFHLVIAECDSSFASVSITRRARTYHEPIVLYNRHYFRSSRPIKSLQTCISTV